MARTIYELIGTVTAKVDPFLKGIDRARRGTQEFRRDWAKAATDVASSGMRITGVLSGIGVGATKLAFDFQDQTTAIRNMMLTLSPEEFGKIEDGIRRLSVEVGRGTDVVSGGIFEAVSAGADYKTILTDIAGVMPLVVAGGAEMAQAVKLQGTILNAYNLQWSETGRISDLVFKTNELGVTNVTDLAGSMGMLADVAAALNISLEDMFGSLASSTKSAPTTAVAVTRLSALMRFLAESSDEANEIFKEYGFETSEAAVRTLGLAKSANILSEATGGSVGALVGLTGRAEAALGVLSIAGQNAERTADAIEQMGEATGTADAAMEAAQARGVEKFRSSLQGLIDRLRGVGLEIMPSVVKMFDRLDAALDSNGDKIQGVLIDALESLLGLVIRVAENGDEIVDWLISVAEAVGSVTGPIVELLANHPELVAFFGLLKGAQMAGVTTAVGSLSTALMTSATLFMSWRGKGTEATKGVAEGVTKAAGAGKKLSGLVASLKGVAKAALSTKLGMLALGAAVATVAYKAGGAMGDLVFGTSDYRSELEALSETESKVADAQERHASARAKEIDELATAGERVAALTMELETAQKNADGLGMSARGLAGEIEGMKGLGYSIFGAGSAVIEAEENSLSELESRAERAAGRVKEISAELERQKKLAEEEKKQADAAAMQAEGDRYAKAAEAEAARMASEKKRQKEIAEEVEKARESARERDTPGIGDQTEFVQMRPDPEAFRAFFDAQEGFMRGDSEELRKRIAALGDGASEQAIGGVIAEFRKQLETRNERVEERKEQFEKNDASRRDLRESLREAFDKGEISRGQADSIANQAMAADKGFGENELTFDQFRERLGELQKSIGEAARNNESIADGAAAYRERLASMVEGEELTEAQQAAHLEMLDSVTTAYAQGRMTFKEAEGELKKLGDYAAGSAEMLAAEKEARDRARMAAGKFTAEEKNRALQDRIISFQRQRMSGQVDRAFEIWKRANGIVEDATESIESFGEATDGATRADDEESSKRMAALTAYLDSEGGVRDSIVNAIANIQQKLQAVGDRISGQERQRLQDEITRLRERLSMVTQPILSGRTSAEARTLQLTMNATVNNQAFDRSKIRELFEALETEAKRRGRSMVVR